MVSDFRSGGSLLGRSYGVRRRATLRARPVVSIRTVVGISEFSAEGSFSGGDRFSGLLEVCGWWQKRWGRSVVET